MAAPAIFIGALSILLVAGLEWLGLLSKLHLQLEALLLEAAAVDHDHVLPLWVIWLATAVLAFGVSVAMLGSSRQWRRVLLWVIALVLVAAWAPVLSLVSYAPHVGAPWIAVLWAGVCALVYASNHRMDGDPEPEDIS